MTYGAILYQLFAVWQLMVLSERLGGGVSPSRLGRFTGSWCPAWASEGMGLGRRGLWLVVGYLGGMGYPLKLSCEIALDKLG